MSTPPQIVLHTVDLRLVHRILQIVIRDTEQQIEKPLQRNNLADAVLELWRASKLKPPFGRLRSYTRLLQDIRTPNSLEDLWQGIKALGEEWEDETIESTVEQVKANRLIHEILLDKNMFEEPSRILILPLGLVFFSRLQQYLSKEVVSVDEFIELVEECHPEHSRYTLDGFSKQLNLGVNRSRSLSPFNTSLALLLLLYGATYRERALKIIVDPTHHIKAHQDVLSEELKRIADRVLKRDPVTRSTLLDHIQESDKIRRVLDDSSLFVRSPASTERGVQYRIYFDLGGQNLEVPESRDRVDRILRVIIVNARKRNPNAASDFLQLLQEHVSGLNKAMQPVHVRSLFGGPPTTQYLMILRQRTQQLVAHLDEVDEQEDDDEQLD